MTNHIDDEVDNVSKEFTLPCATKENMSNQIEKDYESLVKEMEGKVEQAEKLLKEAAELSQKAGIGRPHYYSDWPELKEVLADFFGERTRGWDSSSWCAENWDDSGCSY